MSDSVVWIVDDDEAVCDSLGLLLKTVGLTARTFPDGKSFLENFEDDLPGCIVVDLRMPGMSGLELQDALHQRRSTVPIVFITGHGTVDSAVHAMRAGAIDFLTKPVDDQELLDTIQRAIRMDRESRESLSEREKLAERYATLTNREKEVMALVVEGHANKVMAYDLGVSERTIEIHRSRVMKKMEANSLPHLVRMALDLK
ncbi:MAG: response regulator [Acidobacteria bacterium]|nr:response regulator [Acidobacteriota bacterium]NIM60138.1 response regulator [Acidobacteriota bacterium]NIO57807.1 response regulator [Acidobacteriota bacterium]NIQ28816.1 response regulator [Acidobacteriota bacterium]NIQ83274.1 response regulator [Acidobacteriota bacterium]